MLDPTGRQENTAVNPSQALRGQRERVDVGLFNVNLISAP
jgi:hypothetical protein